MARQDERLDNQYKHAVIDLAYDRNRVKSSEEHLERIKVKIQERKERVPNGYVFEIDKTSPS